MEILGVHNSTNNISSCWEDKRNKQTILFQLGILFCFVNDSDLGRFKFQHYLNTVFENVSIKILLINNIYMKSCLIKYKVKQLLPFKLV